MPPVLFVGCNPSDRVGYPSYFRATYKRGHWFDDSAQLQNVVSAIFSQLRTSELAVPVEMSLVNADDLTAIIDMRVTGSDHANATVQSVADEYTPAWAWLPFVHVVDLVSLERVTAADVYGDAGDHSREGARRKANDAAKNDPIVEVAAALKVLAVVAIVFIGAYLAARLLRESRQFAQLVRRAA